MTRLERLREKANSLPQTPGVYIMKNSDGDIIYVGKSKKLKNRVTSYFVGSSHSIKTSRMVSLVEDFDFILCKTEIEALALENVLIKKHSPKYNIKLKDAKSYPYIKLTYEQYPKLIVTRERRSDKARYFGPYTGSAAAHAALDSILRIFGIPSCKRSFPKDIGKERPCIYKDMGRCVAPCTGKISPSEYGELIKSAERVLEGNSKEVKAELERRMFLASEMMEFERAAYFRDRISALDRLSEKQKVVADEKINRDVFATELHGSVGVLAMLTIRGGTLINKNEFLLTFGEGISGDDMVSLIAAHYDEWGDPPKEIMLDFEISDEERELLSEYLSLGTRYKVAVKIPERGEGKALCNMARENAREAVKQRILESEREDKNVKRLSELMSLSEFPKRIEAYDISNIGDENIVASMVVWSEGKLKKSDYRLFSIKTTEGRDDYGSMREALTRRFSHVGDGTGSLGECPDLLLLDGGDAHVGVAKAVCEKYGLEIPIFGMVKDDFHKTRALTDGEQEISIAKEFDVYAFIYNIQEEAHRFAIKSSQKAKTKTLTTSSLEKIEGIGPKKAKELLLAMPLGKIRTATVEELCKVKGIGEKDAKNIYEYFKNKTKKR